MRASAQLASCLLAACAAPADDGAGGALTGAPSGSSVVSGTTAGFAVSSTTEAVAVSATLSNGFSLCPLTPPADEPCTGLVPLCAYGATQCSCTTSTWRCIACPTRPVTGAPCADVGSLCGYGFLTCTCTPSGWDCGTCPNDPPEAGSSCETLGLGCAYGDYDCACEAEAGGSVTWTCAAPCPTSAPTPGDPCLGAPDQICDYPDVSCACLEHQFFCN